MAQSAFTDVYTAGSTVDIVADVVQPDETMVDADGLPTVTVYDPEGTAVVSAASMSRESTGRYVYYYATATTDKLGMYKATVSADVDTTSSTRTEKASARFRLVS